MTGLDFSRPAIEAARELAAELKIDARFVCADVFDAPGVIEERFDVVFPSVGVFCCIPDLGRWMRVARILGNDDHFEAVRYSELSDLSSLGGSNGAFVC